MKAINTWTLVPFNASPCDACSGNSDRWSRNSTASQSRGRVARVSEWACHGDAGAAALQSQN